MHILMVGHVRGIVKGRTLRNDLCMSVVLCRRRRVVPEGCIEYLLRRRQLLRIHATRSAGGWFLRSLVVVAVGSNVTRCHVAWKRLLTARSVAHVGERLRILVCRFACGLHKKRERRNKMQ